MRTFPRLHVVADPADEGELPGEEPHKAPIVRPELAPEHLGERDVVGVVDRGQAVVVGKDQGVAVQFGGGDEFDGERQEFGQ